MLATMGKWTMISGGIIGAICPIAFSLGLLLWLLMPDCKIGSGGPAYGCILLGLDISGPMGLLVTSGFLGSFFLVPLGIMVFVVGGVIAIFSPERGDTPE
jgi:hypothetical protein